MRPGNLRRWYLGWSVHRWFAQGPSLTRRQFFGLFSIIFALLSVALVGEGFLIRANHGRIVRAEAANSALCALRDDIQARISGAEEFLRKNPHGFDGISGSDIRASIRNQTRTLNAINPHLKCG